VESPAVIVIILPVSEVLRTTPRTRRIRLALGDQPFPYRAGQAVLVTPDEGLPPRPYSIASTPADTARDGVIDLLVRVDDAGEGGTSLDTRLPQVGQQMRVEGPFGRFTTPDIAPGQAVLVAAGGTGIAPLRPMLRELLDRSGLPPITVVYSVRGAEEFAYLDELQSSAALGQLQLVLTVTRGDQTWRGRHGRVDEALLRDSLPSSPAAVVSLVCGPPEFVRDVRGALLALGVPDTQVLREQYDA
jgi:NAD(P)H-flavin reductase